MACSKYEYVKKFESNSQLLLNTFIVVRLDGHSFTRFTSQHSYQKPNDLRGLHLMNCCAQKTLLEFDDVVFAYGQSDEYSFIFKKSSSLWARREAKLITNLCSYFTSCFVLHWKDFFTDSELKYPPCFDARAICYPSFDNLRDYISWRQADCHINNLYNTTFWALVKSGKSEKEAEVILRETDSSGKNELLFSQFQINYNKEPEIFKKGSVLFKESILMQETTKSGSIVNRNRKVVKVVHQDVIGNQFWENTKISFD